MSKDFSELILALNTSSDKAAEKVIAKLVKIGKPVVGTLIEAAADMSQPRIRKWSLQALGAIGDKSAGPVLIKAFKDSRMTVKLHAVRGLGCMKYKPATKALRALLKDPSGGIRINVIDALVEIKDRSSNSAIIRSLSDEQWYVRQHAAMACEKLNIVSAVPKLKKLMKIEKRKAVLNAAAIALKSLAK
ncbi:HEAT repeat domain-containing protein [Bdellovibrio sp. HCB290]|uniref:HEAT repeat domain-containing protein n=1 Tax=Bdellovibrio sp. HCB290 TaxID=3394356 RepID=UPI0039B4E16C